MVTKLCNETITQIATVYFLGYYSRYFLGIYYDVSPTTIGKYLHLAIESNLVNDEIALGIKEVAYRHATESCINLSKVKIAFEKSFKIREEYLKNQIPES
jgi:hypothetical protein